MLEHSGDRVLLRGQDPQKLTEIYGSPLYVYDEITLRERCRQIKKLAGINNVFVYYSTKANSAVALLKIIKEEGIQADAMSLGELYLLQQAGFQHSEIIFMSNNVRHKDMSHILKLRLKICADSLDELEYIFKHTSGSEVNIRINTGITDGHNDKVKTGGAVKFGISIKQLKQAFKLAEKYGVNIDGICSHIGSFFLNYQAYHKNVVKTLKLAEKYPQIKYVDFGGGFGVPYDRMKQNPFPIDKYSKIFLNTLKEWRMNNRDISFGIQPGRFITAEAGVCLCRVRSKKELFDKHFIGTDLGFNFFPRPTLYDSYHEIIPSIKYDSPDKNYDIVGNMCESGDILARDVAMPSDVKLDDVLIVRDAGAYSFAMSSNYTAMTKPAEILIKDNGELRLIRKAESVDSLSRNQIYT